MSKQDVINKAVKRLKSTPPSRGRDFLWIIRGLHRCCSLLNIKPVILQAV